MRISEILRLIATVVLLSVFSLVPIPLVSFRPSGISELLTYTASPFVLQVFSADTVKQLETKAKALDQWQGWKHERERKTSVVFTNEIGQHLGPNTVYNHLKKIVTQIGTPDAYTYT